MTVGKVKGLLASSLVMKVLTEMVLLVYSEAVAVLKEDFSVAS